MNMSLPSAAATSNTGTRHQDPLHPLPRLPVPRSGRPAGAPSAVTTRSASHRMIAGTHAPVALKVIQRRRGNLPLLRSPAEGRTECSAVGPRSPCDLLSSPPEWRHLTTQQPLACRLALDRERKEVKRAIPTGRNEAQRPGLTVSPSVRRLANMPHREGETSQREHQRAPRNGAQEDRR